MTEQQDRTMPPLVVDFDAIEDPEVPGNHYWFVFDNGYSASLLRAHSEDENRKTIGYDEGKWEGLTLYRDEFSQLIGLTYGFPVFDTGLTPDGEGSVAGNLDNLAASEFLTRVAALPERTAPVNNIRINDEENDSE
jgi:hypothetical protein